MDEFGQSFGGGLISFFILNPFPPPSGNRRPTSAGVKASNSFTVNRAMVLTSPQVEGKTIFALHNALHSKDSFYGMLADIAGQYKKEYCY